jgi:hypothetical protein
VHADFGGYYNAHGARMILAEVSCALELDRLFGFAPGSSFLPEQAA